MRITFSVFCFTLIAFCGFAQAQDKAPKPLKALLITGGCCHDYAKQKELLRAGIESRAHVMVDQFHTPDPSTKARFDVIYGNPNWANGYDVIIHDECTSDVKEMPYVENILNAHKSGIPAVNLHCAMHCYRVGTDDWFKFVGIHSTGHGPQKPIDVIFVERDHPITKGSRIGPRSTKSFTTTSACSTPPSRWLAASKTLARKSMTTSWRGPTSTARRASSARRSATTTRRSATRAISTWSRADCCGPATN